MQNINFVTTPGGHPIQSVNPPSAEADPKDSGEGQTLLSNSTISESSENNSQNLKNKRSLIVKYNELLLQNKQLEEKIKTLETKLATYGKQEDYHTDEDEFLLPDEKHEKTTSEEKPTWETYSSRCKKRKADASLSENMVNDEGPAGTSKPLKAKRDIAPPPIYLKSEKNINELTADLVKLNFKGKLVSLPSMNIKINCANSDEYRMLTKTLNESSEREKIEWHTFSDKNNRPIRVLARGLDPATDTKLISDDLKNKGFELISTVNILKTEHQKDPNDENKTKKVKIPLRLFMLTFENSEQIENIYAIRNIAYQSVKIEALRKTSNKIVQCKRCQCFNHVQSSCHRTPRCVKCAGEHLTADCKASKDSPPKCVNCGGNHTASYRGCEIAKDYQKRRNDTASKKKSTVKQNNTTIKVQQHRYLNDKVPPELSSGTFHQQKTLDQMESAERTSGTSILKLQYDDTDDNLSLKENPKTNVDPLELIMESLSNLIKRIDSQEKVFDTRLTNIENSLPKT